MSPATGHLLTALTALGRMAAANEIGMVTSTPDGVRDANDAFLRLTGHTRADLEAGRVHWRVLTAPEWTSLDDSAVDELRETGSYGPHLKEYRRRDGTRLTVEVTGVLVSHEPLSWVTFVRDPAAQPAGERLTDSAERLAALAAELSRDVAVTDVARTLTRHVRQAMGAMGATIMEVDLAGQSMRPVLTDEIPAPIARTYAAFDLQLDAPSTRAWRERQMGFYPDPETTDKTFPHLAGVRAASAVRSCMAVPLVAGDEITGVLTVYWSTPRELSAAERSYRRGGRIRRAGTGPRPVVRGRAGRASPPAGPAGGHGRAGHRGHHRTDRRGPGQGGHGHGRRARRGGRPRRGG